MNSKERVFARIANQKYRLDAVSTISDPMREGADMDMALEYPEDSVPQCAAGIGGTKYTGFRRIRSARKHSAGKSAGCI
jgi:hypothetical protein